MRTSRSRPPGDGGRDGKGCGVGRGAVRCGEGSGWTRERDEGPHPGKHNRVVGGSGPQTPGSWWVVTLPPEGSGTRVEGRSQWGKGETGPYHGDPLGPMEAKPATFAGGVVSSVTTGSAGGGVVSPRARTTVPVLPEDSAGGRGTAHDPEGGTRHPRDEWPRETTPTSPRPPGPASVTSVSTGPPGPPSTPILPRPSAGIPPRSEPWTPSGAGVGGRQSASTGSPGPPGRATVAGRVSGATGPDCRGLRSGRPTSPDQPGATRRPPPPQHWDTPGPQLPRSPGQGQMGGTDGRVVHGDEPLGPQAPVVLSRKVGGDVADDDLGDVDVSSPT